MVYQKILELQNAPGSKAKCDVLKKHKSDQEFCSVLFYALNPFLTYNLSEKTINESIAAGSEDTSVIFDDVFSCCSYLSKLRGIDSTTVRQVGALLRSYPEEERAIYTKLLSKTLRLGVTAKTVNKVIKDLLPVWEVQQAYPIEKYPVKVGERFWLTQKLNGVRATYYKGKLYARSGIPYEGVDHIIRCICEQIIRTTGMTDIVLDGELTLKDKGNLSDNEAFRTSTGIINSDAETKEEIGYTVFDMLPTSEAFESESKSYPYSIRRKILDGIAQNLSNKSSPVKILPVLYEGTNQEMIPRLLDKMVREDKEGLVLNLDVPYKKIRHKGILKVKRFYTMDLPILRCEEGDGRLSGTLGAFVVSFEGNEVRVGSGFSDEQRSVFWKSREDLEGALCEVKYKEISDDKNTGKKSLQFPIFVGLRTDKTEPSYG